MSGDHPEFGLVRENVTEVHDGNHEQDRHGQHTHDEMEDEFQRVDVPQDFEIQTGQRVVHSVHCP